MQKIHRIPARPDDNYRAAAWLHTFDSSRPGVYLNFYDLYARRIEYRYERPIGSVLALRQSAVRCLPFTSTVALKYSANNEVQWLRWPMTGGHLKDCKESFQETVMSENSKRPRRSFSAEFKQDAVDLVVRQGNSFKAASGRCWCCSEESQGLAREVGSRA